jgi:uncharacterized coiled-coil DUF342 family protein
MKNKKCYVILCGIEEIDIKIDSVWLNYDKAFDRLQELKNKRNDIYGELQNYVIFKNDDVYWIKESEIKE